LTGRHGSRGAYVNLPKIVEENLHPCSVFGKDNPFIVDFGQLVTFKIITELQSYGSRGLGRGALSGCRASILDNGSAVITYDDSS
jgi:hypothetical protein